MSPLHGVEGGRAALIRIDGIDYLCKNQSGQEALSYGFVTTEIDVEQSLQKTEACAVYEQVNPFVGVDIANVAAEVLTDVADVAANYPNVKLETASTRECADQQITLDVRATLPDGRKVMLSNVYVTFYDDGLMAMFYDE